MRADKIDLSRRVRSARRYSPSGRRSAGSRARPLTPRRGRYNGESVRSKPVIYARIQAAAYKAEAWQNYTPDCQVHNPQRVSGDGLQ